MSILPLSIPNLPIEISFQISKIQEDLNFYLQHIPEILKNPVLERTENAQKRKESLGCRYLLNNQLIKLNKPILPIDYTIEGKPFMKNGIHFSFSHTSEYVCSILSHDKSIGIDIESNHRKIEKIAPRFLNQIELSHFNTPKKQILAWSMKEAIYKAFAKKGISFREQILLHIENDSYVGIVHHESIAHKMPIYHFQNDDISIAIAIANHPKA